MWGLAAALFQKARRDDLQARKTAAPAMPLLDGTAASRAFCRFPHLCPRDASRGAFVNWLAAATSPNDDADDLYLTMCELAGWQPMPAPAEMPPVATLPVPPAVIETAADAAPLVAAPVNVKHDPAYAAQAFVDWARLSGHCGTHPAARIGELYAEHCREEGFVPLPTKTFRPALLQIKGVRKGLDDDYPAHLGNRRHRPTIWVIEPLATVSGEVPWTDLPNRRAAA